MIWHKEVAREIHQRDLSAGVNDGHYYGHADELRLDFDWALVMRCAEEPPNCDLARPFTNSQRAVFAVDFRGALADSVLSNRYHC